MWDPLRWTDRSSTKPNFRVVFFFFSSWLGWCRMMMIPIDLLHKPEMNRNCWIWLSWVVLNTFEKLRHSLEPPCDLTVVLAPYFDVCPRGKTTTIYHPFPVKLGMDGGSTTSQTVKGVEGKFWPTIKLPGGTPWTRIQSFFRTNLDGFRYLKSSDFSLQLILHQIWAIVWSAKPMRKCPWFTVSPCRVPSMS